MKANPISSFWIMLRSLVAFGFICMEILYKSMRKKLTRQDVDRLVHHWANKMLKIAKIDCHTFNHYHVDFLDKKRYIIMINHTSLYDIPITYHAIPGSIRMVAKKELFNIPIFGATMRACEVPSIDRQNREQAIKDLQIAQEKIASGLIIWIAPEGTRSHDGKLGPLKKGGFIMAIKTGALIVPVGIRGANNILPAKTWNFNLHQKVEVHIGQPVDATKFSMESKDKLIAEVARQLGELSEGGNYNEKI